MGMETASTILNRIINRYLISTLFKFYSIKRTKGLYRNFHIIPPNPMSIRVVILELNTITIGEEYEVASETLNTIQNIDTKVSNSYNKEIILKFYEYFKSMDTSENYQNRVIRQLCTFLNFLIQ